MTGRFITLEGGEGVGKSTQAKALAAALREHGIEVVETREPGGTPGAEAIRRLLLDGADDRWSAEAEALLFAAARTDHVDKLIRPALQASKWVLSDRFVDSSLAYQGGAGALGIDAVRGINGFGIGEWFPDRTLVLILDGGVERALVRDGEGSDRIGRRSIAYHQAVEAGFRAIVAAEPKRVRLIDAAGAPDEVTARLLAALEDLLP
ncbi:dTMP kinase [Sphingosinicella sp.]|uniref:dTMP kinase n=1 Tax=Sphingosinicella sp. TaxID=1917971 RepID=UPI00403818DC